ncbi:TPA: hypothetical protein ACWLUJ_005780 [Pseudomonas aeruginosa]|nr:hypothetical protein [Pseudomonas aeruginosa]EIU2864589.1 hypothetical protein [Pseudomonas aeruginosa]HEJ2342263.1 hypothetical protein [Pseudomonas aeruginosa]HEK3716925.1 hypothetical protein [Pseudomonas aeruginosa]
MENNTRISAVKMVLLALDEVKTHGGLLPTYGEEETEDDAPPKTFLELVKQFAGNRVPESELIVVIDAMAPLFSYPFPWK